MANEGVWRRFLRDLRGFSLRSSRLEAFDREGRKKLAMIAQEKDYVGYSVKLNKKVGPCKTDW